MLKKILFAYPLFKGGTSTEMYKALKRNKELEIFTLFNNINDKIYLGNNLLLERIMFKLKIPFDKYKSNDKLLKYNFKNIDILFIVKGIEIYPWTLKKIKNKYPNLKIISWSQDDMYAWHNRSLYYTFGIKYYDLIITQKSYNVEELKQLGAKKVLFQNKAYSIDLHKKYNCDTVFADVLFIGDYEFDRYEKMLYLANNGIKVDIYGPNWARKVKKIHKNLIIHGKPLIWKEYSNAISCSKISLCFLRKANRDLQTSRSVEIPACGGFMIAERTDEHKQLFEENKEAVYFDTKEELLEKVKYYLENEDERKKIAEAGYERTRNSKYSYDDRVEEMIKVINEI